MLRRLLLTSLIIMGIAGSTWQDVSRLAVAQDATPAATPQVVIVDAVPEYLAVEVVGAVPAPPAQLVLHRVSLDPGGFYRLFGQDGTVALVVVEAGEATVTGDAALAVTRGGPGGDREEIAAGARFMASAGDYFAGGATAEITLENGANEPLGLLIYRINPVPETEPVTSHAVHSAYANGDDLAFAKAVTEAIPPAPTLLELLRFTFAPGGYVKLPETSPSTALIYVESGELTVTMGAEAEVRRTEPGAADPVTDEYAAGTEFTVAAGQSMLGQPHAAVEARNDSEEPVVIYMAVIEPAPAP